MTTSTKITAALALALGLAATPSLAQSVYSDSASYNRMAPSTYGGAYIDPARDRGGLIGGVGNVVGGVTGAAWHHRWRHAGCGRQHRRRDR